MAIILDGCIVSKYQLLESREVESALVLKSCWTKWVIALMADTY